MRSIRFLHASDTHGLFFPIVPTWQSANIDCVFHTGDFCPNLGAGARNRDGEQRFQLEWIDANAEVIRHALHGRTLYTIPGNHDFCHFAERLRKHDIRAHDVHLDGPVTVNGFVIAGFPHCPFLDGYKPTWNWERSDPEIAIHLDDALDAEPDILLTHAPPEGILDGFTSLEPDPSDLSKRIHVPRKGGIASLRRLIDAHNRGEPDPRGRRFPEVILCGHIHEQGGESLQTVDLFINNAAQRVVDISHNSHDRALP